MPNKVKHIRFFTARLWVRQVAWLLCMWLQGILAVGRNGALTFLKHFVNPGDNCLTKKGVAVFLPSTKKDGWVSAAVL
jgi:hypothetical protein